MITKSKEHEPRPMRGMIMSKKYEVTCDYCTPGYDEYVARDWMGLMEIMRDAGWKSIYDKVDGYKNKCPECAGGGLYV